MRAKHKQEEAEAPPAAPSAGMQATLSAPTFSDAMHATTVWLGA
jgi:hypothetical protein